LVGAPIAVQGRWRNGASYVFSYLPMEFSQTSYRELVEPFPFELGMFSNRAKKDEIQDFGNSNPYSSS